MYANIADTVLASAYILCVVGLVALLGLGIVAGVRKLWRRPPPYPTAGNIKIAGARRDGEEPHSLGLRIETGGYEWTIYMCDETAVEVVEALKPWVRSSK